MPAIRCTESGTFEIHGYCINLYVAPSRGGSQLCTWHREVPAGVAGVAHRPSGEEVLLVLSCELRVALNGTQCNRQPGDVAVILVNSELWIDAGPQRASA